MYSKELRAGTQILYISVHKNTICKNQKVYTTQNNHLLMNECATSMQLLHHLGLQRKILMPVTIQITWIKLKHIQNKSKSNRKKKCVILMSV